MADLKPRESFVVYKTAVDAMNALNDTPELQGRFAKSILQFGVYHDYDDRGDPVIDALMSQQQFNIDMAAQRYEIAKENGSKGGRKQKGSPEEVYTYYKVEGHTLEETVEHFGCAKRTIQDKCKKYLESKKLADAGIVQQEDGTWRF